MSKHVACPHCGQRMAYMRAGARLPPKKARIFDTIKRAGSGGISGPEVIEALGLDVGENGIRAHVWQINQILERFGADAHIAQRDRSYKIIGKKSKIGVAKEKRL